MKNIIKLSVLVMFAAFFMTSCAPSKYYSDGKVTKVSGRAANTYVKKPKVKIKNRPVVSQFPYYGYENWGSKPAPIAGTREAWWYQVSR